MAAVCLCAIFLSGFRKEKVQLLAKDEQPKPKRPDPRDLLKYLTFARVHAIL